MGVVYKALDPKIDRVLAVKIISARLDTEPEPPLAVSARKTVRLPNCPTKTS